MVAWRRGGGDLLLAWALPLCSSLLRAVLPGPLLEVPQGFERCLVVRGRAARGHGGRGGQEGAGARSPGARRGGALRAAWGDGFASRGSGRRALAAGGEHCAHVMGIVNQYANNKQSVQTINQVGYTLTGPTGDTIVDVPYFTAGPLQFPICQTTIAQPFFGDVCVPVILGCMDSTSFNYIQPVGDP